MIFTGKCSNHIVVWPRVYAINANLKLNFHLCVHPVWRSSHG